MLNAPVGDDFAKADHKLLTTLLGSIQAVILVLFIFGTTYSPKDYSPSEYIVFRDIMGMSLSLCVIRDDALLVLSSGCSGTILTSVFLLLLFSSRQLCFCWVLAFS